MIAAVPVPERMAHLPLDSRGYPIPVVVARDAATGQPLFIVNDSRVSRDCVKKKLCAICGQRMIKQLWFIGGALSAFHPHGHYFDSAMHWECATYALKVCPYLAMSKHRTAVADPLVAKLSNRLGGAVLVDHTQDPKRPEPFVLVMAFGQTVKPSPVAGTMYIKPLRPYHAVEFWRHGQRIEHEEGMAMIARQPGLDLSALRLISPADNTAP